MTWYQKPKRPADPVVTPGMCAVCGELGSVQLGESIVPEIHRGIPRALWLCQRCADEHRGDAGSN
jgi:hypothetical protein